MPIELVWNSIWSKEWNISSYLGSCKHRNQNTQNSQSSDFDEKWSEIIFSEPNYQINHITYYFIHEITLIGCILQYYDEKCLVL